MTAPEQASAWCHWLASRGVTLSQDEMRAMFERGLQWKVEDPRMLREQIRVADVAFNHLHKECAQLRSCLEPGTAPAIMHGLFSEAERLGFYQPTAKHALTQFVEEIEELRAKLAAASERESKAREGLQKIHDCDPGKLTAMEMPQTWMAREALKLSTPAAMAQQKGGGNPNESEAKK